MAGINEVQPADIKERLRKKTPEELTEEMEALSSTPNYDVELLCAYLDVLEEKAPVLPEGYSPSADFEAFQEAHAELFTMAESRSKKSSATATPATPKKRRFSVKRAVIAVAATLCLIMCIAEAYTPGTMERIVEWGSETFLLRTSAGAMELPVADENGFLSLQDALDHYGVMGAVIPTRVPKRFSLNKITAMETDDTIILGGRYVSKDGAALLVRVVVNSKENYIFEREMRDSFDDPDNRKTHEANGIAFVISENFDERRATWSINGCACSLSGDITEDELKGVLDSIQ